MLPLHDVVLGLLLQPAGLLVFLLLHGPLLLVELDQVLLLLVLGGRGLLGHGQSPPVVDGWLSFDEKIELFVIEVVHLLALLGVAQSGQEFVDASEAHDLVLDGGIGGLEASVFLLEGLLDDAEWRRGYLAVSLQRMLRP